MSAMTARNPGLPSSRAMLFHAPVERIIDHGHTVSVGQKTHTQVRPMNPAPPVIR